MFIVYLQANFKYNLISKLNNLLKCSYNYYGLKYMEFKDYYIFKGVIDIQYIFTVD